MLCLRHWMTISSIVSYAEEDYLHRENTQRNRPVRSEDTPMLFIFNRQNSIQIAWNGKLPVRRPESRLQQLDTRFGTIGFIRTYNVG
ncbi:hypothetical protein GA0061103_6176 [Rhizobium multihospitium]|uniref:Uncharacterized protein n=1 Tax=Rhizobium multihospitium TaxID=410764 RepID=A0A1C3WSC7_9HYPH|nr:hypothetical protein GA0061103_6176 [Rhizobium multihospitium]